MSNKAFLEFTDDDNSVLAIWKLMIKLINRITPDRALTLLKSTMANYELYEDEYDKVMEIIIDEVLKEYKEYGVNKTDLFNHKKRGQAYNALKLCVIITTEQLNVEPIKISEFFGRSTRQTVHFILREFETDKKANQNNPQIREFLQKHQIATSRIVPQIEEIKKKQTAT